MVINNKVESVYAKCLKLRLVNIFQTSLRRKYPNTGRAATAEKKLIWKLLPTASSNQREAEIKAKE